MRLLLDAHVSGPRVGAPLRRAGHDVRALDAEPDLEGLDDDAVLDLATRDARILVTLDVADFPAILRDRAEKGRPHAGVILVHGIGHAEFGMIVRGLERWLAARPEQDAWIDFPAVVSRESAAR